MPQPGDVVRPNGFVVNIDQSVNVASLQNNAITGVAEGGSFTVTQPNLTLECYVRGYAGTHCLTTSSSGDNLTVIGNSYAETLAGNGILITENITLFFIGDSYSGFVNSRYSTANNSGIRMNAGTIHGVGNLYSRGGGNAFGLLISDSSNNSSWVGNSYNNSNMLHVQGAGLAIFNNSTFHFDGIAEHISSLATDLPRSAAITTSLGASLSGNIIAIGSATNSGCGVCSALLSGSNTIINHSINRIGSGAGTNVRYSNNMPTITVIDQNGNPLTLTDPAQTDPPEPKDLREGVVAAGGAVVGTLKVPPKGLVAWGVPTDDTVGEAILTAEAVAQAAAQVVGAQFNSFKA